MGIRWGAPYRGNLLWGFYFQLPRNASFLHPIPTFYVFCSGNEIKLKHCICIITRNLTQPELLPFTCNNCCSLCCVYQVWKIVNALLKRLSLNKRTQKIEKCRTWHLLLAVLKIMM